MTKAPQLVLGPKLVVPGIEGQTGTWIVYGGKGMGKTNFGSVLAEEASRNGLRFSWLDPYGVAWGLKWSADGRGEGLPILKIGGQKADIKLVPTTRAAQSTADLVCDEDVSVLIDISRHADGKMWSNADRVRFVRDYCNHLFMRQGESRRPLLQIIDECGRFAPQQIARGSEFIAECLGAIEQLVEIGRNVGVGVVLMTQRSARMAKSVSELADIMVAFRTVGPNSIDAILDWFGEHVPKARQKELIERVRQLPVGTALVVSPGWLGIEGEYAMRARTTFDSSQTPRAGEERRVTGKGARVDVEKYRALMAEIEQEADANDPGTLRKELRDARNEIARLSNQTVSTPDPVVERVEVPTAPKGLVDALSDVAKRLDTIGSDLSVLGDDVSRILSNVRAVATIDVKELEARAASAAARPAASASTTSAPVVRPAIPRTRPAAGAASTSRESSDLSGPERRVLDALAWWESVGRPRPTKQQLAFTAGYRVKKVGGTYGNVLGALRSRGLIDYPEPAVVSLTDTGRAAASFPDIEATTEGLQRAFFERLDGPERRVLRALIGVYPDELDKIELGSRAGYTVTKVGGTYGNVLGSLRSLGLIDYPRAGVARASHSLFLEAR